MDVAQTVLAVLSGLGTLAAAIFGGIATFALTRSKRAADDVKAMTEHMKTLEGQVNVLQGWQLAARMYIWQLRATLADRGIAAPESPPELGLAADSS
ncbi:hypothetical protein [Amycolatopsis kentuckyensis]|uniref:hypothetical protein n=1 Tax=Amycolatopsis kentuckyensis TaxID=218823 RepID=UPI003568DEDB